MSTPTSILPEPKSALAKLVEHISNYQPVITIAGCLISFFVGNAVKLYTSDIERKEKITEQWRDVAEKLGRGGSYTLKDALLIESFRSHREYEDPVRQLEVHILPDISDPDTFDYVYFGLQHRTRQDQLRDLEDVDRSLSQEVRALMSYAVFPQDEISLSLSPEQRLQRFLLNPSSYLNDQRKIDRAERLIYELDSVSSGFGCIWKNHRPECPSLHPTGQEGPDMIIVNNDLKEIFSDSRSRPSFFKTCSIGTIHQGDQEIEVECSAGPS